ncbi:MAG: glycosyltransferase [Nitrococcus sp.]|nr:glycosyltransferase [Nitrococcus sp.]
MTLLRGLKVRGWAVAVACFYAGGPLQYEVEKVGIPVHDLGKRGRWDVLQFMWRTARLLWTERPEILHSYLPVPNLLSVFLLIFFRKMRVIWGVRASDMDLSHYDRLRRVSFWLERRCAGFPHMVIANSEAGARIRIAQGFPVSTMRAIPNGVDTERFRLDVDGRLRLRSKWGIAAKAVLVGVVGRLDPMKGHSTFLQAAAAVTRNNSHCRFVCVGDGPPEYTNALRRAALGLGVDGRVIWAGARDDMAAVYSALDIACSSSSWGEGFSNAVAEAMACERACVVTDVGDSAAIVGDAGRVVPPSDPAALSSAVLELLRLGHEGRSQLGAQGRRRVVELFSVERMLDATTQALKCL